MKYTLPEAYTLTQSTQDAYNQKQEAITKFFQENILPIKEEGHLTFSFRGSEISNTFTDEEFINILEEHGYTVGYGGEGEMINLLAQIDVIDGSGLVNFWDDEEHTRLLDDAVRGRMAIYWEDN